MMMAFMRRICRNWIVVIQALTPIRQMVYQIKQRHTLSCLQESRYCLFGLKCLSSAEAVLLAVIRNPRAVWTEMASWLIPCRFSHKRMSLRLWPEDHCHNPLQLLVLFQTRTGSLLEKYWPRRMRRIWQKWMGLPTTSVQRTFATHMSITSQETNWWRCQW